MRDDRLRRLADVLVQYSVGVKPGQLVRLSGPPVAAPLLVELYRSTLRAGGHPMVRSAPDELAEILLKHGSDEQLQYVNPVNLKEHETVDASIGIWAEDNTRALSNVDPKRMRLSEAARRPLMDLFMQRAAAGALKWSGTQFPCQAAAKKPR